MRITFKKQKRMNFRTFDVYHVRVSGVLLGGLTCDPSSIGFSFAANARYGLPWKNTWADKETFATFEEAKAACVAFLKATLREEDFR